MKAARKTERLGARMAGWIERSAHEVVDVPAMAEFLPGFDINSWGGICGPAGLPTDMVEKLNALTKEALESDDVKNAYLKNGATPFWKNVADTVAYRRAEETRFGPIVKASGARVD